LESHNTLAWSFGISKVSHEYKTSQHCILGSSDECTFCERKTHALLSLFFPIPSKVEKTENKVRVSPTQRAANIQRNTKKAETIMNMNIKIDNDIHEVHFWQQHEKRKKHKKPNNDNDLKRNMEKKSVVTCPNI